MSLNLSVSRSLYSLQVISLSNEHLKIEMLPELGGKIWSINHLPSGEEMLWHNPRVSPHKGAFGSSFDDHWSGGWDEIFPNDVAFLYQGDPRPDHGELWALPWQWRIVQQDQERIAIAMNATTPITPARFTRTVSLTRDKAEIGLTYQIENLSPDELLFQWKMHPAFKVVPGSKLLLPNADVLIDPDCNRGWSEDQYDWSVIDGSEGSVDMCMVPHPDVRTVDLHYATRIGDGSLTVAHPHTDLRWSLIWDQEVLNSIWLFLDYGGWRGHHVACLEPCTGFPIDFETAVKQGTVGRLNGGETLTTEVFVRAHTP